MKKYVFQYQKNEDIAAFVFLAAIAFGLIFFSSVLLPMLGKTAASIFPLITY